MPAIRGNFAPELDPAVRTIYFDRYNQMPELASQILHMEDMDRNTEDDSATSAFSLLQQTSELGALDYEDPTKMYRTTYTPLKYTKGFKVSVELLEDDQHGTIKKMPAALAKATRRTTEFWSASVLNNSFSTSYTSYGDGKPLNSTSHTRADGGTAQSNADSSGRALSESNLETVRVQLDKLFDDKGQIIAFDHSKLIVPVDLRKTAKVIVDSPMRSGTANNEINIYSDMSLVVWRWLTSATAWFLQDTSEHLLNFRWRTRPEFKNDFNFDADAALYKTRIRFATGWSDYRGFGGSKGDGAAYSS